MKRVISILSLLILLGGFTAAVCADKGIYLAGIYYPEGIEAAPVKTAPALDDTTAFLFHTPGTFPGGLGWDGEYFWNGDADSMRIYKFTTAGQVVASFPGPSMFAFAGMEWLDSLVWVVDEQEARAYRINPITGQSVGYLTLPDSAAPDPNSFGLAYDGVNMWHSQYGDRAQIFKLNPATGAVLFAFTPPSQALLGIAWDGECICGVSILPLMMYRMDPLTGGVVESIPWEVPYPLGLLWKDLHFYNISSGSIGGGQYAVFRVYTDALEVTLTPLNPPIQIPAGGGSFSFDAVIENHTSIPINFDAWTEVLLPNTQVFGPLVLRTNLTAPAGAVILRQITQNVPPSAPTGNYVYVGRVGDYPDSTLTYDSFNFTKIAGEGAPGFNRGWEVYGWDDEDGFRIQDSGFRIFSANPNPFNPTTALSFKLQTASEIILAIYDVSGREMEHLIEGYYPSGTHQVVWDASSMASGVYFARLEAGDMVQTQKLLLVK